MESIDHSIKEFRDILIPIHFKNIVRCINILGEYEEMTGVYMKPTSIGTALKYIIKLFEVNCLQNNNLIARRRAKDLLHLLNTCLPSHVNKNATESLLKLKRQKPTILPSRDDIKKINVYILSKRKFYFKKLNNGFNYNIWLELAKHTLISVLIFNRRRPGELERAQIKDLDSIESISKTNEDMVKKFSEFDKRAAESYKRFSIRGKLARGVPALLHKNMEECVTKILDHRKEAGVHPKNPYIFGLPQIKNISGSNISHRHLSATDLMRELSKKCGANNPETLRATQLRKHIATKSVSLNLKDVL